MALSGRTAIVEHEARGTLTIDEVLAGTRVTVVQRIGIRPAIHARSWPLLRSLGVTGEPWQQRFVLLVVGIHPTGGIQVKGENGIDGVHGFNRVAGFQVPLAELGASVHSG